MRQALRVMLLQLALGLLLVNGTQVWIQPSQADTMLAQMLAARACQTQIVPLSHSFGAFSMETAYYIQTALAREVVKAILRNQPCLLQP